MTAVEPARPAPESLLAGAGSSISSLASCSPRTSCSEAGWCSAWETVTATRRRSMISMGGSSFPGWIDGHVHIERSLLTPALVSRSRITGPIVLGQGSLLRPAH